MALSITKSTSVGEDASYWKILSLQMDVAENALIVEIGGYAAKAKSDAGYNPFARQSERLDASGLDLNGNLRQQAYDAIQAQAQTTTFVDTGEVDGNGDPIMETQVTFTPFFYNAEDA
jgi:hypothetical protein